jgi:hypothetical protein
MDRGIAWSLAFVLFIVVIAAFYILMNSRPTYWVYG